MNGDVDNFKTVGRATLDSFHDAGYVWEVHQDENGEFYFRNSRREKILRINDDGVSTGQNTLDDRMRFTLQAPGDCELFAIQNNREDFLYQNNVGTIRGSTQADLKEYFSFIPLDDTGSFCEDRSQCFSNRCYEETCRFECSQDNLCTSETLHHYCSEHAFCENLFFCSNSKLCEEKKELGMPCENKYHVSLSTCRA
jgi:hypothetical protein